MCWKEARLLTSIMIFPSRCVFPSWHVCCFPVLNFLCAATGETGSYLNVDWTQLSAPAATIWILGTSGECVAIWVTAIKHQLTGLLVEQATACVLMTEQTASHQPDAFICTKPPWACKSLEVALSALSDMQIFAEGGGYLLLLRSHWLNIGCKAATPADTPGMLWKDPQTKGEVKFKLNCIHHLIHCMFVQLWLTVWAMNRLRFTCCWMSRIIAHPVVVIILIRWERMRVKWHSRLQHPSPELAERHMSVAAQSMLRCTVVVFHMYCWHIKWGTYGTISAWDSNSENLLFHKNVKYLTKLGNNFSGLRGCIVAVSLLHNVQAVSNLLSLFSDWWVSI